MDRPERWRRVTEAVHLRGALARGRSLAHGTQDRFAKARQDPAVASSAAASSGGRLTFLFAGLEKVVRGPGYSGPYFVELRIAWPQILGPLVSYFELIGAVCLLLGLATRILGVLFACEMIVAIAVVRLRSRPRQTASWTPLRRSAWKRCWPWPRSRSRSSVRVDGQPTPAWFDCVKGWSSPAERSTQIREDYWAMLVTRKSSKEKRMGALVVALET